jgi:hypothetical protein
MNHLGSSIYLLQVEFKSMHLFNIPRMKVKFLIMGSIY